MNADERPKVNIPPTPSPTRTCEQNIRTWAVRYSALSPRPGLRHSHQASQLRFGVKPFTVLGKKYTHYRLKKDKTKEKFNVVRKSIPKPLAEVFF